MEAWMFLLPIIALCVCACVLIVQHELYMRSQEREVGLRPWR